LNYIGYEDFGVCGHIVKTANNTSDYMILDASLNISDVSRRFYQATFGHVFEKEIGQISLKFGTFLVKLSIFESKTA
jgi:hypothetical protein